MELNKDLRINTVKQTATMYYLCLPPPQKKWNITALTVSSLSFIPTNWQLTSNLPNQTPKTRVAQSSSQRATYYIIIVHYSIVFNTFVQASIMWVTSRVVHCLCYYYSSNLLTVHTLQIVNITYQYTNKLY